MIKNEFSFKYRKRSNIYILIERNLPNGLPNIKPKKNHNKKVSIQIKELIILFRLIV